MTFVDVVWKLLRRRTLYCNNFYCNKTFCTTENRGRNQESPSRVHSEENLWRYSLYCVRLWVNWSDYRASTTGIPVLPLAVLSGSTQELQYWLIHFILEIRKKNSSEYPPNTLHHFGGGGVALGEEDSRRSQPQGITEHNNVHEWVVFCSP